MKRTIYFIFVLFILGVYVDSQYYYFSDPTNSFNGYQQGCQEQLEVRFNTDGKKTVGGIFHLILDDSKISYVTGGSLSSLLFKGSTLGFPDWVPTFPKRKAGSNYTILETERYNASNPTSTVNGNKPYGYVIFIPKYSGSIYTVDFGMSYISGYTWTTETTLSYDGVDIINPSQQVLYLTGTIDVQQKPCVNDSSGPSIVDNIYTNGATKISNSGLNISLFDSNGQGQVPFVWKNGERTGNLWSINNQYGIDTGTINIQVSGNNHFVNLNHTNFDVEPLIFKTWQDLDRDYTITLNHLELFDFGIEKQIYITYFAKDRVGNTTETSISFNKPKEPRLTQVSPSNGQSHITYDANISFNMHDDRAGVDSGSIVVIFSGIGNAFYAEYYSGDLSFEAISGDANIDDYKVVLQSHLEFPTNSDISMIIYGYDLAGNGGQLYSGQFVTKPSCADLGCCDGIKISTGYQLHYMDYLNSVLYVSGGNNPYLYLDGNTGYINCNLQNNFLSIYAGGGDGTGDFRGNSTFDELQIIGDDVKATLSGNVLILERINVDNTPPVTTDDVDGEWRNTDLEVTLTAVDTGVLVDYTLYCTGTDTSCIPNITGTSLVVSCETGMTCPLQYVRYYSVDLAGNVEEIKTSLEIKIDKQVPDFDFNSGSAMECEDLTLQITNADDYNGVGRHSSGSYSFNGSNWLTTTSITISGQQPGTGVVTGYVRDALLNTASKQITYTFTDSLPTGHNFTGNANVGSEKRTENWKTGSNAKDGKCGAGEMSFDSIVTQGTKGVCEVSGDNISYTPNPATTGNDSCVIKITDNENNDIDITVYWGNLNGVIIDDIAPETTSNISSGWRNTDLDVILTAEDNEGGVGVDYTLYCTGTESCKPNITGKTFTVSCPENNVCTGLYVSYYSVDLAGNVEQTQTSPEIKIDKQASTFEFNNNSGDECVDGILFITNTGDLGVGFNTISGYSFDGTSWTGTSSILIPKQQAGGTVTRTGYVRDLLDNRSSAKTAIYTFTDTPPTANDFTGHENVGNSAKTVNWKTGSNATEGACGSGYIDFDSIVTQGTKGACSGSVSSENLTYTPNSGQEGNDSCTIRIKDNEGSTGVFVVYWEGIDTLAPTIVEVTQVPSPTQDTIPSYTFSSDEAGTITYGGSCSSLTTGAISGDNIITFNALAEGTYSNCTIQVTDSAGNQSNILEVSPFTIDKTAPVTTDNANSDWRKTDLPVTLTATDTGAGVANTYYCTGTESCIPNTTGKTATLSCPENNVCTGLYLRYYSVDEAGNTEEINTSPVIRIDKQAPTFTFNSGSAMECEDLTLQITNADDYNGVGRHSSGSYSFNGSNWLTTTSITISGQQPGTGVVTGYVRDALLNTASKQITYTFTDSLPTGHNFTGHANVGSEKRTENWKTGSNAKDGKCGAGDMSFDSIVTQGTKGECEVSGDNISYTPNPATTGNDSCVIKIQDNENNDIDITVYWGNLNGIIIDDIAPETTSNISSGWRNTDLEVILTAEDNEGGVGVANTYYCTGTDTCRPNITGTTFTVSCPENNVCTGIYVRYYSEDGSGNIEQIQTSPEIKIDKQAATFEFNNNSGDECVDGTLFITNTGDVGVGFNTISGYSFDGTSWTGTSYIRIPQQQTGGTVTRTGYVRDLLGNVSSAKTAIYTFTDTPPTANDFTGHENVGNSAKIVNWKTGSNATEGACGSGYIDFDSIVTQGTKGVCSGSVSSENLTYTPNSGQEGNDSCTIRIKDNEGSTGVFVVYWEGIDTIPPITTDNADSDWRKTDLTVTLTATDIGAGVANTYYCTGTESCIPNTTGTTATLSCPENNVCTGLYVRYYSVDEAGNIEQTKTSSEIKIDKQAATFEFNNNSGDECVDGTLFITNTGDVGVGFNTISGYSFDGTSWTGTSSILIPKQQAGGTATRTGYVRDLLGNVSLAQTAIYIFNDVPPTANDFTGHENVGSGERTVNWKDLSNATDGECGAGYIDFDSIVTQGTKGECEVSGDNISYTPNPATTGNDSCVIKIKDNENNDIDITVYWGNLNGIIIDDIAPETTSNISSGWRNTDLDVILTAEDNEGGVGVDYTLYCTGTDTSCIPNITGTSLVVSCDTGTTCPSQYVRYYSVDLEGNEEQVKTSPEIKIDKQAPIFMFNNNSGYECATGTLAITNVVDIGVGLHSSPYSFDGVNWGVVESINIIGQQSGTVIRTGYVRDALGNTMQKTGAYTFSDAMPTASNFTGHADVGSGVKTVNWKIGSSATDGACGAGDISFDAIVNTGTKGVCSISGDNIIYTPNPGAVGNDSCEISIKDNEGNSINITVSWGNISNISGTPSGGGGGGGGGGLRKDNCCINGGLPGGNILCEDNSDSYYDGTCEGGGFHGGSDLCGVNQSSHSDELKLAYLYSYKYGITTMCPIWEAVLDGYLYRNHFAKMISEYAINVLGEKPNIGKKGCDQFQDIENDTDELKHFMKTACELNLMGLHADGKTPKDNFDPHDIVTRAEFGTVFSRLLFGKKYNVKDESLVNKEEGYWYRDHLAGLKSYGVMTKIDGERPKYKEKRGWVMLMMMRAEKFGIFAGKVPALMGITSLFK